MRLVKATYREARKLEAGLRRKPRLDMVGRSHEENLMPTVTQLIGNGKRRIDMAGGSTGRNDEIHGRLPFKRSEKCTPYPRPLAEQGITTGS